MSIPIRFSLAVAVALSAAAAGVARAEEPDDEPAMVALRGRFRDGLERYRAGDFDEAIRVWEPLLSELGPDKGYRIAFDLGRAYESSGDASRAVERFELFLRGADSAEARGVALPELVIALRAQVRARVAALIAAHGRIAIAASLRARAVVVDAAPPRAGAFVAFVAPGRHRVTIEADDGSRDIREVVIEAGQLVSLPLALPPAPPQPARPWAPAPLATRAERRVHGGWVWGAWAATAASLALPALAYSNAAALHDQYSAPHVPTSQERSEYNLARSLAYVSWIGPLLTGSAATLLSVWYAEGVRVVVVPSVGASGGQVEVGGSF